MADTLQLTVCSYNCRGYNATKKNYLTTLLSRSAVLFMQEHWLSENQCSLLADLRDNCSYIAVSGFTQNEVLSGRPFG
jgi:hypothetical protein